MLAAAYAMLSVGASIAVFAPFSAPAFSEGSPSVFVDASATAFAVSPTTRYIMFSRVPSALKASSGTGRQIHSLFLLLRLPRMLAWPSSASMAAFLSSRFPLLMILCSSSSPDPSTIGVGIISGGFSWNLTCLTGGKKIRFGVRIDVVERWRLGKGLFRRIP